MSEHKWKPLYSVPELEDTLPLEISIDTDGDLWLEEQDDDKWVIVIPSSHLRAVAEAIIKELDKNA